MQLKILLPFKVFADVANVLRVVADTHQGSFGLLPHRLDCVAALTPGILTYETEANGVVYVAIDEGTLVKAGSQAQVSVRRAVSGTDLAQEFLTLDEREQSVRSVMAKLETGFLRRFASFQHD